MIKIRKKKTVRPVVEDFSATEGKFSPSHFLFVLGLLFFLGGIYLLPASYLFLEGRTDHFLSIGNDSTSLPFQYHVLKEAFQRSFTELLFGTVHTSQFNTPHGFGMWIPWIDRIIVAPASLFIPLEMLPTLYLWVIMILNGAMFYLFAKNEGWKNWVALSLSLCFAFNSYVRARGVVHNSLSAIYFLPALFLALRLLQRKPRGKTFLIASGLLLLSVMTAHYYIMILVALTPFFLWFYFRTPGPGAVLDEAFKRRSGRLVLAALPALLFLIWNVTQPLHPRIPPSSETVQKIPVYPHFLLVFSAHPIDYLAHDVGLGARDLNPLRAGINERITANLAYSHPWERSNGIRWTLLLLFGCALYWLIQRSTRQAMDRMHRGELFFFVIFAGATFWLSLTPKSIPWFGEFGVGPSIWIHWLMPGFRVPSRVGPVVHFAVIMVAGILISTWLKDKDLRLKRRSHETALAVLFPLLLLVDYSPVQPMEMRPALADLSFLETGRDRICGTGIYVPYVGGAGLTGEQEAEVYAQMQRLRNTRCSLEVTSSASRHASRLMRLFGEKSLSQFPLARFKKYVECAQLDWIGFGKSVDESGRKLICASLGWNSLGPNHCQSPVPRTIILSPEKCL